MEGALKVRSMRLCRCKVGSQLRNGRAAAADEDPSSACWARSERTSRRRESALSGSGTGGPRLMEVSSNLPTVGI